MNWNTVIKLANDETSTSTQKVLKSKEEWRTLLTPEQFRVTREQGTEPAFSGEACESHKEGKYSCTCCSSLLFDTTIKFDSGSGWPSFTTPISEEAISYIKDVSHGMVRVEVQCTTCDAHLGHVFPDGPEPTGLRFCINSVAIQFLSE